MVSKSQFDMFVAAGKAAGIENYVIRCEGGNRMFYHNNESGIIYPFSDYIICIEYSRNYAKSDGQFSISLVPYDNIDTIKFIDVPFVEGLTIADKLSCKDDVFIKFAESAPRMMAIQPGTAGLAPNTKTEKDVNGKEVTKQIIDGPYAGYITK